LDGDAGLSLRLDVIVLAKLSVGDVVDARRLRELEDEDQRLDAIDGALRLLSMGPRSERDLRDRLRRRGLRRPAIDAAVERMRELGYLDDAAFARTFVESRLGATPRSRRALTFELGRKGVDREVAATAVAALSDEDSAMEAAQRRLRSLRGLDRAAFSRRLGTFLASRGFGYGVARGVIDRCWTEVSAADEAPV
jgi:regulatory protein